jgi:hypothetical protein
MAGLAGLAGPAICFGSLLSGSIVAWVDGLKGA